MTENAAGGLFQQEKQPTSLKDIKSSLDSLPKCWMRFFKERRANAAKARARRNCSKENGKGTTGETWETYSVKRKNEKQLTS